MQYFKLFFNRLFAVLLGLIGLGAGAAQAASNENWQYHFPDPVSPLAKQMVSFHNDWLMPLIVVITIFVFLLLVYVCFRFREKANPTPSRTTHNALLEVVWTIVPVLILVVLFVPSIRLLYATDKTADAEMTIKITGHQWYWEYEYPDHGGFAFDAQLIARTHEEAEKAGVQRLMDTENVVVLPVDTKIRLQFTSADVIHNWAVSDFGVRVDTVPGRLNEAWTQVEQTGQYYGFCSELCGIDHAFMPISVRVVSKEEFAAWVKEAQQKFAKAEGDAAVALR